MLGPVLEDKDTPTLHWDIRADVIATIASHRSCIALSWKITVQPPFCGSKGQLQYSPSLLPSMHGMGWHLSGIPFNPLLKNPTEIMVLITTLLVEKGSVMAMATFTSPFWAWEEGGHGRSFHLRVNGRKGKGEPMVRLCPFFEDNYKSSLLLKRRALCSERQ